VGPDQGGGRPGTDQRLPQGVSGHPGAEHLAGDATLGQRGGERFQREAMVLIRRAGEYDPRPDLRPRHPGQRRGNRAGQQVLGCDVPGGGQILAAQVA
jgi:hypothetical protein